MNQFWNNNGIFWINLGVSYRIKWEIVVRSRIDCWGNGISRIFSIMIFFLSRACEVKYLSVLRLQFKRFWTKGYFKLRGFFLEWMKHIICINFRKYLISNWSVRYVIHSKKILSPLAALPTSTLLLNFKWFWYTIEASYWPGSAHNPKENSSTEFSHMILVSNLHLCLWRKFLS